MERPSQEKTWQARNELQKLIDGAGLCDRDSRGKVVPWKDASGRGASQMVLKSVLNALLTFYPQMYPSIATIASRCGLGERTVERAIAVLQAHEVLQVEQTRQGYRGGKLNRYAILGTRLRQLGQQQRSLFATKRHQDATNRHRAPNQAPPGANLPPPVAHKQQETTTEELNQEGEGRRGGIVLGEKRGEVLQLAHRVRQVTGPLSQEQADEVIQACLWTVEGRLAEHAFEICLESTKNARPRNAFRYWKTCIGNQLREEPAR